MRKSSGVRKDVSADKKESPNLKKPIDNRVNLCYNVNVNEGSNHWRRLWRTGNCEFKSRLPSKGSGLEIPSKVFRMPFLSAANGSEGVAAPKRLTRRPKSARSVSDSSPVEERSAGKCLLNTRRQNTRACGMATTEEARLRLRHVWKNAINGLTK